MSDENRRLTEFVSDDDDGEDERDGVGDDASDTDPQDAGSEGAGGDDADHDPTADESEVREDTDGGQGTANDDQADTAVDQVDAADDQVDTTDHRADVAPAVSTATWSPDGAPCEACGSDVQRRWRDDGALVCVDCAEW